MEMPTVERASIPLRVPVQIKERAEYAASLRGESLNGFIASMLAEASERIIEDERVIRLSEDGARRLVEMLESPPELTDRMMKVASEHRAISRG